MRKARNLLRGNRIRFGVMTLMMMLTLGFAFVNFSFVSHAESKGKVTASSSVNIRKEASSGSAVVGSAEKDSVVDIRGKATASDGTVWYQVFVNANTIGYIRSDLVEITDGTTPPAVEATTGTQTTTQTAQTTNTNEQTVAVEAVEPVSGTVINGQKVRVRSNASTTSSIVTSVQNGSALTVTGRATGADSKVWYQVEFIASGTSVVGFIRSDYVSLSGELVPVTETVEPVPEQPAVPETTDEPTVPEVNKTWETQLQGDKWYLLNMETQKQTEITSLFNAAETNAQLYADSEKKVNSQKIAIIILVILLIAVAAVAALLFLKIKDMTDSAYFSEVERETVRRRNDSRQQPNKKVVHTVGPDKKPASKPQGSRPAGAQSQGTKPQGNRPAGGQSQGSRPAGAQPQGAKPQGSRPAGAQPQTLKPPVAKPQAAKPQGRPADAPKNTNAQQNPGWKSKNFMTDDDEFEFEFLNWDGEEE